MDEQKILKTIERFAKRLPKFPDGRINYSESKSAPVITVFVKYKDELLLLKRSQNVLTYRGKWNVVAGYLDELKPIKEKVLEELREEIGLREDEILSITYGNSYKSKDKKINRMWIIHPVIVELKSKPKIKLDREHTEFKWIKSEELTSFDIVTDLDKSLKRVLK